MALHHRCVRYVYVHIGARPVPSAETATIHIQTASISIPTFLALPRNKRLYAKLVHARRNPGTYAALTSLPVVQLWPEKQSKKDVLDYTLAYGTPDQQSEATRVLYAEFGAEVGGQASIFLGSNLPLTLAGAGIGHVTARLQHERAPPTTAVGARRRADRETKHRNCA